MGTLRVRNPMSTPATEMRVTHPAALWGIFGFILILSQAVYRLTPLALEPIVGGGLENWHWGLYAVSILFNAYSEGYKAFQLQVAPRVIARALHLSANPRPLHVALAPLFCMTLFHASRKRLTISWIVYAAIVTVVIAVRQLEQPYRGIIDAGVVVGLTWGIIAILAVFFAAVGGRHPDASADLPASA